MMRIAQLTASGLGIGYIGKGGGTIAAAVTCLVWYFAQARGYGCFSFLLFTVIITLSGVWASAKVEAVWGKDPQRVVIDEIAGMSVSLLYLPYSAGYVITALVLFRFFDIVKPLFIRKTEALPGGWGIMADDILAGIYTNVILQLIISFNVY